MEGSSLTLNGHQLREALGFLAPDGSEEQLDQELVLYTGEDTFESKPIVYAYYNEYPEEGVTVIDGDSELGHAFVPAGEVTGAVQGKVLDSKLPNAVKELLRVDSLAIRTSAAFNRSMDDLRSTFMSEQVDQHCAAEDALSSGTPPGE